MAKPRRVKLLWGDVLFNKFPKDIGDALQAYIAKFTMVPEKATSSGVPTYPEVALGFTKNSNGVFQIVVLGYNLENKESIVLEVKDVGSLKGHAASMFNQELFKRGLV